MGSSARHASRTLVRLANTLGVTADALPMVSGEPQAETEVGIDAERDVEENG